MIVARLLDPRSKLAVRDLGEESAATSLGESLEVEAAQAEARAVLNDESESDTHFFAECPPVVPAQ